MMPILKLLLQLIAKDSNFSLVLPTKSFNLNIILDFNFKVMRHLKFEVFKNISDKCIH